MSSPFVDLVDADLAELTDWLLGAQPRNEDFSDQERLGVLEVYTALVTAAAQDPGPEPGWDRIGAAYSAALTSADLGRVAAAASAFNLTSVLLRNLPPDRTVPLFDPDRAARAFLELIPWPADTAARLADGWQQRDMTTMRQLRDVKNLLRPLATFAGLISDDGLREALAPWLALLPHLP